MTSISTKIICNFMSHLQVGTCIPAQNVVSFDKFIVQSGFFEVNQWAESLTQV